MNEEQLQKYENMAHHEYIDEYGSPSVAQAVRDLVAEVRRLNGQLSMQTAMTQGAIDTVTMLAEQTCQCRVYYNSLLAQNMTLTIDCPIHKSEDT
jgi:thiaminase